MAAGDSGGDAWQEAKTRMDDLVRAG
jgi:hypothetical protein